MKLEHILVATDFSQAGTYAVAEATAWARHYKSALHVVHVVPPKRWFAGIFGPADALHEAACNHAAMSLKEISEGIDTAHIPQITTGVLEGPAARTISHAAQVFSSDLLVIGARGEHREPVNWTGLGGTAAKLSSAPTVPTLLVRREPARSKPLVLAPVDMTPISRSVLQWAYRCCHEGELRILHAYEVPFSSRLRTYGVAESAIDVYTADEQAKRARQLADLIAQSNSPSTVQIRQIIERVDSSEGLLEHIRRFDGTTLVLGKHRSDSDRTAPNYNSVCDYAARFCPRNVLIVPPDVET
jgi:nucleotide-binding universal stress UspA family protein